MSLSKIKHLAKDSVIYGISSVVSRLIVVLLVPVYTRIFAPADYAIINLINTTFLIVGILSFCALDSAAARWFYDSNDTSERKTTFASWFWTQLFLSACLAVVLFVAMPFFAKYVFKIDANELRGIWALACATLLTNILPSIIWNWYRLQRRAKATMIFTVSQSLFTILLTILFVVVLKLHIPGVYLALFISSLLFSILAVLQLHSWLQIRYYSRQRIKQMLRFSMPMVPAAIAFWLINSAGVYFLNFLDGNAAEVGLFGIGMTVASAVSLFTGAFQQAWGPFAFSIINEPHAKRTYANVFLTFGIGTSLLILFMFLFSPEILMVFTTPQYYDAAWVASIMSINVVLIAFTYIASIGTSIMKNSVHYSVGVLLGAVATVGFYFLLIPVFGKEGAAIATVASQLIVPIYLFYKAQKLYPIPYRFSHVVLLQLAAISVGVSMRLIPFTDQVHALEAKILALFSFVAVVFLYSRRVIKIPFNFKLVSSIT